ncbi:hypothetical protein ACFYRC_34210 [Streptomyces sp. NPDC005279]|uniref:hypothetical protein n=1 Tax=Streptomyces sp. NPDC005279 TaxID=3364712 RepID=UPI0036B446ED
MRQPAGHRAGDRLHQQARHTLIADQCAGELGGDAHTHADRNGDMHVARPSGATS